MRRILQVFCIFLSAITLAMGIPNEMYLLGFPACGFLALIPLYIVYSSLKSYKEAFFYMALQAGLVHFFASYWLSYFKDFAALTLGASTAGTAVIAGICGLFFYLPFAKFGGPDSENSAFFENKISFSSKKIFWFAICYVNYEWVKSVGFLGYPWGTLCQTIYHFKILAQIADITGTYGITFLLSSFAALCGEGILIFYRRTTEESKRRAFFSFICSTATILMLFTCTFVYGIYQYTKSRNPVKTVNTIMVQQNADPWKISSDNETILTSERLTSEKMDEAKSKNIDVDLVVWSEGCLKYRFPGAKSHYMFHPKEKPLIDFIKETNVPFLLGGSYIPEYAKSKRFNGALLFDPDGNFRGAYPKNHLVPIAEAVPFADIKPVADFFKKVIGISAGWAAGDKYTMFNIPCHFPEKKHPEESNVISLKKSYEETLEKEIPYVTFSAPICYDDAFPDICTPLSKFGSEFFMNITDDSWSMTKSSEYQHFVMAYFRAIELRTTLARSTNAGYSVVINPSGKIIMDMPLFEQHAELVQIPVYKQTDTIYKKFGNWLPALCFGIIICVFAVEFIQKDKTYIVKSERKKFKKSRKRKNLIK